MKRLSVVTSEKWSIYSAASSHKWQDVDIFWVIFPEINRQRRWIMQLMSDLYSGCLNWRPYKFLFHFVHCKRILRGCSWLRSVIIFCMSAWSQVWSASSSSTGRMSRPISMTRWLWWLSPSRSSLRRRISQSPREDVWATPTSGKQGRSLNGKLVYWCNTSLQVFYWCRL